MKKLIFTFSILLFIACDSEPKQEKVAAPDYIYEATYLDTFTLDDQSNVLLVQEMHKHLIAKDFEKAFSYLADEIVFSNGDGTSVEGKEAVIEFISENFSAVNINNYQVGVNFSVQGDNGDQWVLLWDNAELETPNGDKTNFAWMEAFQLKDGKIVRMNQFAKPVL